MLLLRRKIKIDLQIILGCVALLIIIGLIFIYSSSSVYALEKFNSAHYFVRKQSIGLAIGIIGMIVASLLPLAYIKRWCPYFFWGSLGLTMMTYISHFTVHIHGSSRWMNILGLVFQPSELLKMSFIIYISYLLAKKENSMRSLTHTYLPLIVIIGVTSIVLLKQPDFGLTVTLGATAFFLMFIAQIPTTYMLGTLGFLAPVLLGLIYFRAYRLRRIMTFLNPWADPQGAGFQIIQSLIAIGSGNLWGVGISHSKQKFFYLPMQHTDFIFAIIAEETGFLGSFLLITLYATLFYVGIRLACYFKDPFCFFTTVGFFILTSLQTIINLAVASGLAPTKGTGLPFISYGNTALVCNLGMIGLIIAITRSALTNNETK